MGRIFVAVLLCCSCTQVVADPDRVLVPGGVFPMGCSLEDTDCEADEGLAGGTAVPVPAFWIDRFEVSVAEYRACVGAGECPSPKDHERNKYCNLGAAERDNHPVNCVDWQEAVDYCTWVGARLPNEAEWEKAARGGSLMRYPWGQDASCAEAVLDDGKTTGSVAKEFDGCGEDRTWPRGSRSPNPLGLYDMHGNAGEWVANWYAPDALAALYANGDLAGPSEGRRRLVRGGSWDEGPLNLRSSFRNVKPPVSGGAVYGSIGFRCAADIE